MRFGDPPHVLGEHDERSRDRSLQALRDEKADADGEDRSGRRNQQHLGEPADEVAALADERQAADRATAVDDRHLDADRAGAQERRDGAVSGFARRAHGTVDLCQNLSVRGRHLGPDKPRHLGDWAQAVEDQRSVAGRDGLGGGGGDHVGGDQEAFALVGHIAVGFLPKIEDCGAGERQPDRDDDEAPQASANRVAGNDRKRHRISRRIRSDRSIAHGRDRPGGIEQHARAPQSWATTITILLHAWPACSVGEPRAVAERVTSCAAASHRDWFRIALGPFSRCACVLARP